MEDEGQAVGGADGGGSPDGVVRTEKEMDDDVDRLLGRLEAPEEIVARGEAAAGPGDEEYEAAMDEHYKDQIEDVAEGLRHGGVDVDGTGVGRPLGTAPMTGSLYRPPAVVERERAEAAEGGRDAEAPFPPAVHGASDARDAGEAAAGAVVGAFAQAVEREVDPEARALMDRLADAHGAGVRTFCETMRDEMQSVRELIPNLKTDDVKALLVAVEGLGEFLKVKGADDKRREDVSRNRWRWPLRGAAVLGMLGMLAGGAAVEWRYDVLGDGTNTWKRIVWERHGLTIAECMKRARDRKRGEVCAVSATIR